MVLGKKKVFLYTGSGAGKTTSALGVALRAVGQGKTVSIVQFMKGRKGIGEYKVKGKLGPKYRIKQFGTERFIKLTKPTEADRRRGQKALDYAFKAAREKPFLLVLDEVNLAAAIGLVEEEDVLQLLKEAPPQTHIYLTGRRAPLSLRKAADYVTEVIDRKRAKARARKGIEY